MRKLRQNVLTLSKQNEIQNNLFCFFPIKKLVKKPWISIKLHFPMENCFVKNVATRSAANVTGAL